MQKTYIEQSWYDYRNNEYREIAIEWCESYRFAYFDESAKKQLDSQSNLSYNTANENPPLPALWSRAGEDSFGHNYDHKWNRKHRK